MGFVALSVAHSLHGDIAIAGTVVCISCGNGDALIMYERIKGDMAGPVMSTLKQMSGQWNGIGGGRRVVGVL